ncbi:MAG: MgtC/SapB family protein [Peptococcaceae bacterium]|jgi:putative Mg2+ transporter-C (MgtC) family protein|nr:MgtC/SapB family protein [Peptococcaceae bacterium]
MNEQIVMMVRILLAMVLGGIVGFERELHNRWAGFRTHILVCVGSCLIMLTSIYLADSYSGGGNPDPGRLAAQVVSGIGFLGAGTILHSSSHIRGLTTAANLWMIAGVGLAVGCGLYLPAVLTTVLGYIVLEYLTPLETHIRSKRIRVPWTVRIIVQGGESSQSAVYALLDDFELVIQNTKIENTPDGTEMRLEVMSNPSFDQNFFVTMARQIVGVSEVGIAHSQKGPGE